MIKARMKRESGRDLILLGLSAENLRKLQADQPIYFDGSVLGLGDHDVAIVYGKTEEVIADTFRLSNRHNSG